MGRLRRDPEPKLDHLGNPHGIQRREQNGGHDATFTAAQRTNRSWCRPAQNGVHQGQ